MRVSPNEVFIPTLHLPDTNTPAIAAFHYSADGFDTDALIIMYRDRFEAWEQGKFIGKSDTLVTMLGMCGTYFMDRKS